MILLSTHTTYHRVLRRLRDGEVPPLQLFMSAISSLQAADQGFCPDPLPKPRVESLGKNSPLSPASHQFVLHAPNFVTDEHIAFFDFEPSIANALQGNVLPIVLISSKAITGPQCDRAGAAIHKLIGTSISLCRTILLVAVPLRIRLGLVPVLGQGERQQPYFLGRPVRRDDYPAWLPRNLANTLHSSPPRDSSLWCYERPSSLALSSRVCLILAANFQKPKMPDASSTK